MTGGANISRGQFLRLATMSMAGAAAFSRTTGQQPFSTTVGDASLEALFARSSVFDGVIDFDVQRGTELPDLRPGALKRLTGIDFGNITTRIQRLDAINELMNRSRTGAVRILRFSDFAAARAARRFGGLYYVQQAFDSELRGSVEPIAIWKEKGLRTLQVTYRDNLLGGGSESDDQPLTDLGRRVVKELNRLHLMVDVSHTGLRTTLDVAAHSDRPVTANHANANGLTPHRRNKTNEELKAIAATGGVVGVTNIGRFMLRDWSRPGSIDDFVSHIDYMVQLIGIDHVGISSDSSLDGSQVYDVDFTDPFLNSYQRWQHVASRLRARGYSDEDLQKLLGLNFLRVYEQVLEP